MSLRAGPSGARAAVVRFVNPVIHRSRQSHLINPRRHVCAIVSARCLEISLASSRGPAAFHVRHLTSQSGNLVRQSPWAPSPQNPEDVMLGAVIISLSAHSACSSRAGGRWRDGPLPRGSERLVLFQFRLEIPGHAP
jgi:hypothetical protein